MAKVKRYIQFITFSVRCVHGSDFIKSTRAQDNKRSTLLRFDRIDSRDVSCVFFWCPVKGELSMVRDSGLQEEYTANPDRRVRPRVTA